jgi:hypothetical protein
MSSMLASPSSRARAPRTASRNVRAWLRPASSTAADSSEVKRSSAATTRPEETRHPPEISWTDETWLSCGRSWRANHATSASADDNWSAQAPFRLFLRNRSTLTTAATSTIAPISHHTHAGVVLALLDVDFAASDGVAVGVAAVVVDGAGVVG